MYVFTIGGFWRKAAFQVSIAMVQDQARGTQGGDQHPGYWLSATAKQRFEGVPAYAGEPAWRVAPQVESRLPVFE